MYLTSGSITVQQKMFDNTEDKSAATGTIFYNRYGHYFISQCSSCHKPFFLLEGL